MWQVLGIFFFKLHALIVSLKLSSIMLKLSSIMQCLRYIKLMPQNFRTINVKYLSIKNSFFLLIFLNIPELFPWNSMDSMCYEYEMLFAAQFDVRNFVNQIHGNSLTHKTNYPLRTPTLSLPLTRYRKDSIDTK